MSAAGWEIVLRRTVALETGPLAGWRSFPPGWDPYRDQAGPFGFRMRPDGAIEAGFAPEARHCDRGGAVSTRALAAFVDFAAIDISRPARAPRHSVTVAAQLSHHAPAVPGALIIAEAEASGGRYWLIAGLMRQSGQLIARFQASLALVT